MTDFIIAGILILIVGGAVVYIVKAKKKGAKCIGCPAAGNCPSHQKHQGNGKKAECTCGCTKN